MAAAPLKFTVACELTLASNGQAELTAMTLQPVAPEVAPVHRQRPTIDDIKESIRNGNISLHTTREPLTKDDLSSLQNNTQRSFGLPCGKDGLWNVLADDKLHKLLAKPKASRGAPMKDAVDVKQYEELSVAYDNVNKDYEKAKEELAEKNERIRNLENDIQMYEATEEALKKENADLKRKRAMSSPSSAMGSDSDSDS